MAAPGPALLFALRQAITGGFASGVATGAGLGLAAAGWTGAALLGLDAAFRLVPWAYVLLKIAGAAYLIWIARGLWRDARAPLADSGHPERRAFLGGVLVNLANPKSVLFAASILVMIFPPDLALAEKAMIVANHFIVELIVYTLFAAALSGQAARQGYVRAKPLLDRIAAAVLGALGLRLLLDR
jgi:threonine/homoserine/homoserine lactone efflux protein